MNGFGADGPQNERRKIVTKTSPENVEKGKEVVGKRNVLLYVIVLFFFYIYILKVFQDRNHRRRRYVA